MKDWNIPHRHHHKKKIECNPVFRSTQIITEEAAQEREEGKTGSDNDDSNEVSDEEDIENLLAPQEETQQK